MRKTILALTIVVLTGLIHSCADSAAQATVENKNNSIGGTPPPGPVPPPQRFGKGLMGGVNTSTNNALAYTATLVNGTDPTEITIAGVPISSALMGEITGVAINLDGTLGVLGGGDTLSGNTIAYVVDVDNSAATAISSINGITGIFRGDAISENSSKALFGGEDGSNTPILYSVNLLAQTTNPVAIPLSGSVYSTALDSDGLLGLIGGGDILTSPFAFVVDTNTNTATDLSLGGTGIVTSVAIDSTGTRGLLGLTNSLTTPAYTVDIGALSTTAITYVGISPDTINSVAITRAGTKGVIGGSDATLDARAYIVDVPTSVANEIKGLATNGQINSVAIDTAGFTALLGGNTFASEAIAYTVDLSTLVATQIVGLPNPGTIDSVEIQDSGTAGIIGGTDGSTATAFLLPDLIHTPTLAIRLNLTGLTTPGRINSVSVDALLNSIPTDGLSGNNLKLARYINDNDSDLAAYFIPAFLEGKLEDALESVAPTRTASSLFALNNNFFTFTESISRRARNVRQLDRLKTYSDELSYLASRNDDLSYYTDDCDINELWGEIIGFNAYQNEQDQTPRFHPWSVGFILGYDVEKCADARLGVGVAYMYTHLHHGEGGGHSNINQEYVSIYGLWQRCSFYIDGAIWAGLFQIHNVRDIHLTAFDFRVKSFIRGLQIDPHLELGYDYRFYQDNFTIEPFGMVDWVLNWQPANQEFGNGPFHFVQKNLHASMLRTELGLRFYEEFCFCCGKLILQEGASYIYRKPFSIGSYVGFIRGAPGFGSVGFETFTSAQNLGSASLLFLFEPSYSCLPTGTFGYRAEFGSGYQSHEISLGFEWGF